MPQKEFKAKEGNAFYHKSDGSFFGFAVTFGNESTDSIDNYEEREYIPENNE